MWKTFSNDSRFLISIHGGQRKEVRYSSAERKEISARNLITRKSSLQEQRGNRDIFNQGKLRESVASRFMLKKWLKEIL